MGLTGEDGWEARAVFRDTFLAMIEDRAHRRRLVEYGIFLYDTCLEAAPGRSTRHQESVLVRDLRAAANNLEFAQAFLHHLSQAAFESQLTPEELQLAQFARHAAVRVSDAVQEIREMVRPMGGGE